MEGGGLQGGFQPEAREQENVVKKDEGKIKYNKTNKNTKKIKNTKTKTNPQIEYNKKGNNKVPLTMITVNANGLKRKVESLKNIIKHHGAGLVTIQETNYKKKGKLQLDEFEVFEAMRKKEGGGTLVGAHKTLDPMLIEEYSEDIELVVIEITVAGKQIRVMSGYGPQECWPVEKRMNFFQALEEEVVKAEMAGRSIILSMDANSKMGTEHIPGDPNKKSENGKVLEGVLQRHGLVVANGLQEKVSGVVTRERTTKERTEKSAIDLVCVSEDLVEEICKLEVDEKKEYALESIMKTKKGIKVSKSDHNTIISQFKLERNTTTDKERVEVFNFKDKDSLAKFKVLTSEEGILTKKVRDEDSVNVATKKLLKRINGCIYQSFKKIRITDHKEGNEISELFDKRRCLRKNSDEKSKKELEKVEEELSEKCAEKNYKVVQDELRGIEDDVNGFNAAKLWKLKKKLSPQTREPPVSMCDESGNRITSSANLKTHTMKHYKKVLSNRPIKEEFKQIKEEKEELCRRRIEMAKKNKSEPWSMEDLETVLKYLKKKKSKDPNDLANEIFHNDNAGSDMKKSILHLMNKIKVDLEIPEAFGKCNITSIHKKGKKSEFDNYRGVFRVTVLRNILDRLLYNDIYPIVDENLTDANVGARKGRSIRDNLFVLNAVMNSVIKGNEQPCEIGVYDLEKAFDSLWAEECINDLFDAGCKDDKLVLMHLENQNAQVAAKTSGGITERENIKNIIMQGTVTGGLCCTTTTDKLAKHCYTNKHLLYKYKGEVEVPPLLMIDDILTISKCGVAAVAMNSTVNTFIETKKLKLKQSKCAALHVGKQSTSCPTLKVHGESMHKEDSVKYLGEIVHKSGTTKANMKARQVKAHTIVAEVRAILSEIPLGKYRTEVGLQLREAMFINGVLFNSEVWQAATKTEIADLEKIDNQLLRTICKAHAKTPVEFLYLETGCVPLRYVIASRRLKYLHHIINREDKELIKRVYNAQKTTPSKGDFAELIKTDIKLLGDDMDEETIQRMTKTEFKTLVKQMINKAAENDLKEQQKTHSKLNLLKYDQLKIQSYMVDRRMTNSMVELMVGMRSSMVRGVTQNFVSSSVRTQCPMKCRDTARDTQRHLLECPVLLAGLSVQEDEMRGSIEYNDIYGDAEMQLCITPTLMRLLEIREEKMEMQGLPVGTLAGPSLQCLIVDKGNI